jgi:hypothetical protein
MDVDGLSDPARRPSVALAAVALALLAGACQSGPSSNAAVSRPDHSVDLPDARRSDAPSSSDATRADARTDSRPPRDATHGADARARDATTHDAGRPDATTAPGDGGAKDAGVDVGVIQDSGVPLDVVVGDATSSGPPPGMDSGAPDSPADAPKLDACGVCDRVWVCNGFADTWVSTSSDACAYIRSGVTAATLYCENGNDTINYPAATDADDSQTAGVWQQTSSGLTLTYFAFGTPMVITCVPPGS